MSRVPDDKRPETAQWLIEARSDAGFTNAKAFLEAVKQAEGSAPSYSTYAQWESGAVTPRKVSLAPIRRFHAARQTAPEPTTATETPDPLVAVIQSLVDELRLWRTEDRERLAGVEATVRALAGSALAAQATPEPTTPHALDGTTG